MGVGVLVGNGVGDGVAVGEGASPSSSPGVGTREGEAASLGKASSSMSPGVGIEETPSSLLPSTSFLTLSSPSPPPFFLLASLSSRSHFFT